MQRKPLCTTLKINTRTEDGTKMEKKAFDSILYSFGISTLNAKVIQLIYIV